MFYIHRITPNKQNLINRSNIGASRGLFVFYIGNVHLFTESFVSCLLPFYSSFWTETLRQLLVLVPPEDWIFKMASLCYFLVLSHGSALFPVSRCNSGSISSFLIFPLPADHSWQRNREEKSWRRLKTKSKGSAYFQQNGRNYDKCELSNFNKPKWLLAFW